MDDMDDIDEIRKRKLEELKEQQEQQQQENSGEEQMNEEAVREHLLKQVLTNDARSRLTNVRLVDEERAQKVENTLIHLYQNNQIQDKVGENQLKEILKETKEDNNFDIKRR